MNMSKAVRLGAVLALAVPIFTGSALAQTAADLGKTLTPMGAEKAGNAAGTIPEWTGGVTTPPAGYKPGGPRIDPFAADKPLFTITAENAEQYAANLSEGHKAMFKQYPQSFKMNVYPTRRSANAPQAIYDAIKANVGTAKLAEGGYGVENAKTGVPFPLPKTGQEAIWNHLLRWRGGLGLSRTITQVNPQADGTFTPITIEEKAMSLYQRPEGPAGNTSAYFFQEVVAPARLAGEILLVHETINQVKEPRTAWTYNPGQRRVRRAPNVAYDNPGTASDGLRTSDQLDMFNGAIDRYDWALVGKKEIYIPYNAYRLMDESNKLEDIIKPRHLNTDLTRYELHRVWVVDATLKAGTNHIYKRRTFYIDEDSWQASVVDHYDGRDQMWRVGESHAINFYEVQSNWIAMELFHDLQTARYTAQRIANVKFDAPWTENDFSPDGLRQAGVR